MVHLEILHYLANSSLHFWGTESGTVGRKITWSCQRFAFRPSLGRGCRRSTTCSRRTRWNRRRPGRSDLKNAAGPFRVFHLYLGDKPFKTQLYFRCQQKSLLYNLSQTNTLVKSYKTDFNACLNHRLLSQFTPNCNPEGEMLRTQQVHNLEEEEPSKEFLTESLNLCK